MPDQLFAALLCVAAVAIATYYAFHPDLLEKP